MASENKDEMAKHASWSEGILGDKAAPSAVAYSWIDRNVPVSGRTHMLLADLTAGVHARNPGLSVQQAVLAAAKDMVQKGVATSDLRTFVQQGGRFSRPGAPDTFAVEDRFYFGKGRKERFASKEQALAFIKQYKRNEDSNAHSENVVLLAKFMGNSRAAKLASLVQQINEVAGHMPHGVGQFQYNELHAPLWKQFIAQYGDLYASVK